MATRDVGGESEEVHVEMPTRREIRDLRRELKEQKKRPSDNA